ncbi:MAG: hypothetical protein AABX01_00320 [Candidatus Micrarchaeota archaeon]
MNNHQNQKATEIEAPSSQRAFIFTIDAMFSLGAIALLAMVYMILSNSHFEAQRYSSLENQGRDYLSLYYRQNIAIYPNNFSVLTGSHRAYNLGYMRMTFDHGPLNSIRHYLVNISGSWYVENGRVYVTYDDPAIIKNAIAPSFNYSDMYAEVSAMFTASGGSGPRMGIGIRSGYDGKRYVCIMDGSSQLVLWAANSWSQDLSYSQPGYLKSEYIDLLQNNDWYKMWILANRTQISCGIRSIKWGFPEQINFVDNQYSWGFPTLYAVENGYGNDVYFDNFSVYTLSVPGNNTLLRSVLYHYNYPCDNPINDAPYGILKTDSCLKFQENLTQIRKEVWIS